MKYKFLFGFSIYNLFYGMRFFIYTPVFLFLLTIYTSITGFGQELIITDNEINEVLIISPEIKMGLKCSGSYRDSECSSCRSTTELINISLNIDCPAFLKAELTFQNKQNEPIITKLENIGLVKIDNKKFMFSTNSINLNQIFKCKTQNRFRVKIYFSKYALAEYLRTNNLLTPKIFIKRMKNDESLTLIKEDTVILEAYTKLKINGGFRRRLYDFQPVLIMQNTNINSINYTAEKLRVNDDCKFSDRTSVFRVLSAKNKFHNPTGNFQPLQEKHLIIYYDSNWDVESVKAAISFTNDFFSRNKVGIKLVIDSISDQPIDFNEPNKIYISFVGPPIDSSLGVTNCDGSIKKIEIYSTHNPTTLAHEIGHYYDLLHTQCELSETCSRAYVCVSTSSIDNCMYSVENESTNLMYPSRNTEGISIMTVGQVYKLNIISANCTDGSSPPVNLNI